MYLKTQKFLILGVSKSGYAVAKYALSKGAHCSLCEELTSPKIDRAIKELAELGAVVLSRLEAINRLEQIDVLVLSPGVPINHEIAVKAKSLGKRIIGELEFGFLQFAPTSVAITGTNGKTTTVTMIDEILKEAKRKSKLVGNVGVPITSLISEIDAETICVTEVSSFQLESINAFCPHVACVLNISPDHLERHYTMENYVFLKKRVFSNQRESEYTVLNFDDQTVREFYSETRGKVVWVSVRDKVDGAYRLDGKLYFKDECVMDESALKLKGEHNTYDALFAIACCKLLGVANEYIVSSLSSFKGIRHRVELICEKDGVKYYNDSKATNTASTINALGVMDSPTVLILGGSEKGEDYRELFEKIKESQIRHVVITGASRFNMLETAGKVGFTDFTVTGDFFCAVKIADLFAREGDCVLLSPACASFDTFGGYEERGNAFVKAVEEL